MFEQLRTRYERSKILRMFVQSVLIWQRENCPEMGAALAYYALFSLFPIILVILSIFGFWLGPNTYTYNQIMKFAEEALPPAAASVVQSTLTSLNTSSVGAGVTGFLILLFTASGVFAALSRACNRIWGVHPSPHTPRKVAGMAIAFIREKLFAFLLVLGTALLILLSFLSTLAINITYRIIQNFSESIEIIQIDKLVSIENLQVGSSFLVLGLVLVVLYKVLPATSVAWRDVWLGALIASSVLLILQQMVSSSIVQVGSRFTSYGVIGGVMVLLFWIYITCQVFFFGAALTYSYAHIFGSQRSRRPNSLPNPPSPNF